MGLDVGDQPFLTAEKALGRINTWLDSKGWTRYTRFEPTRTNPRGVIAAVDTVAFFEAEYPVETATMEVFWRPTGEGLHDDVRIEWVERPDDHVDEAAVTTTDPLLPEGFTLAVGLHQDPRPHHDDLDHAAHFQVERPDADPERVGYDPTGETPLSALADFVAHVPYLVSEVRAELGGDRFD